MIATGALAIGARPTLAQAPEDAAQQLPTDQPAPAQTPDTTAAPDANDGSVAPGATAVPTQAPGEDPAPAADAAPDETDAVDMSQFALEDLLNATVTTASRTAERVDVAPGSMSVITRDQIQHMHARNLREVLNAFIPGMDVVPTYFVYGDQVSEGIYSRGLLSDFSQQVLILWNGVSKFNESTWGTPFTAVELTLENVERIEISRSPIPLYGGGAFTVINIITRDQYMVGSQGEIALSVAPVELGRGDGRLLGRRFSGVFGDYLGDYHIGGSLQYYDDAGFAHRDAAGAGGYDFATYGDDTLRDGMKHSASATLTLRDRAERFVLQTWFKDANRDAFLSGRVPSQSTDLYNYRGRVWMNQAVYRPVANLQLSAGLTLFKWTNFIDFAGTPYGGGEHNVDAFVDANYTFKFKGAGTHALLAGVKAESEGQYKGTIYSFNQSTMPASAGWTSATDSDCSDGVCIFAPNDKRQVIGVYAEDTWKVGPELGLLIGGRADFYAGYVGKTELALNPRVSAVWSPGAGRAELEQLDLSTAAERAAPKTRLTFKALYASATRPPSIYERSGTSLVPLVGNPDVDSERVHTFELSSIVRRGGLKLQVTPFLQLFNNKLQYIDEDPTDADTRSVAHNHGSLTSYGSDLELTYQADVRSYAYLRATWLRSEEHGETDTGSSDGDRRTPFLPSVYVSAGANVGVGKANLNLNGYLRGPRELPEGQHANIAAGAHRTQLVVNASVTYPLLAELSGYVLAQNLTTDALREQGRLVNYVPLAQDGLFAPMHGLTIVVGLTYGSRWSNPASPTTATAQR